MPSEIVRPRPRKRWALIVSTLLLGGLTACERKEGAAIVLEKEHIAAAEMHATPIATPGSNPASNRADEEEPAPSEPGADVVVVDSYVMKKADRGTGRDPRATDHQQWLIKVELVAGGRRFDVQADSAQYHRIRNGDQVRVRYLEGKYTHTVWGAEIE